LGTCPSLLSLHAANLFNMSNPPPYVVFSDHKTLSGANGSMGWLRDTHNNSDRNRQQCLSWNAFEAMICLRAASTTKWLDRFCKSVSTSLLSRSIQSSRDKPLPFRGGVVDLTGTLQIRRSLCASRSLSSRQPAGGFDRFSEPCSYHVSPGWRSVLSPGSAFSAAHRPSPSSWCPGSQWARRRSR